MKIGEMVCWKEGEFDNAGRLVDIIGDAADVYTQKGIVRMPVRDLCLLHQTPMPSRWHFNPAIVGQPEDCPYIDVLNVGYQLNQGCGTWPYDDGGGSVFSTDLRRCNTCMAGGCRMLMHRPYGCPVGRCNFDPKTRCTCDDCLKNNKVGEHEYLEQEKRAKLIKQQQLAPGLNVAWWERVETSPTSSVSNFHEGYIVSVDGDNIEVMPCIFNREFINDRVTRRIARADLVEGQFTRPMETRSHAQ